METVLQCPASVDQNSHWGEAHHGIVSTWILKVFFLSSDYRPSVDRPSTKRWPITDRYIGEVSTNYRRSVGEKSAKCRWTKSYIGRDTSGKTIDRVSTECRQTIVRVSTDCRPTIDRYIDRVSTDYRPTVDRLSAECRPLYRPIDRSTLPTVNMILFFSIQILILLNVTQQCRCSPMLIFRAWATCGLVRNLEADRARDESIASERSVGGIANRVNGHGTATSLLWISGGIEAWNNFPAELFASSDGHSGNHCPALSFS